MAIFHATPILTLRDLNPQAGTPVLPFASRSLGAAVVTLFGLLAWLPAAAQTRTEELNRLRRERMQAIEATPQTFIDRAVAFAEQKRLVERVAPEAGFYPRMGSITIGGGLAFGGGYRRAFANDNLFVDSTALLTIKGYRLGRVDLSLPRLLKQTLDLKTSVRLAYFPEEEFFGLGPYSRESERTNFRLSETEYVVQFGWRPRRWLRLATQEAWRYPRIGPGTDGDHPSTDTRFVDATTPGLNGTTNYFEAGGLAEASYLNRPANPHRGGRYVAYLASYDDRHDRGFDFARVATQVEQYVPIFDRKRVIVVRGTANHLRAAPGSRVPFCYMTPFGGRDSSRGFDDLRFRDANAWLLNAEYRWEAIAGVDLALFYDRGSVAPRFRDLSWHNARESYGVGVRLGTARAIVMRAEVAFGSREGVNYYVAMGAPLRVESFLR